MNDKRRARKLARQFIKDLPEFREHEEIFVDEILKSMWAIDAGENYEVVLAHCIINMAERIAANAHSP
jgi:uncharacterized protein YutE (UPF0331/DUF86 family)